MSIEELYHGRGRDGDSKPSIDIIAVHGLNPYNNSDHAVDTWKDEKSGHLWLRDSLPRSQPNARVLLYAYESSPVFGTDKERFVHQANSLLECLRLKRRSDPVRPLIMMGHSLGGILIKQALVNAQNNPKYKSIKDSTFGLVFFGTPHAGPSDELKVKFGKVCVAIAQSMPWIVSNDIMEALKKGSLFSDALHEGWRHQLEQYRFLSFYEGLGSLVPRESAVLGLGGERENQVRLNANHSDMCRFNPKIKADRDNYFYVEGNIADLCDLRTVHGIEHREYKEFIQSLRSVGSNPRWERISRRHQESFRWIWGKGRNGPGFVGWLNSNHPIFWITGLPGSGKSTLMKYLHEDSGNHLVSPSGHNCPSLIGYFFHELGEDQEKTFTGFLASFLAQLVTAFGDLAALVLPLFREQFENYSDDRLDDLPMDKTAFHIKEQILMKALRIVVEQQTVTGSVILYLDGLDECSGDNRTQVNDLIELVESSGKGKLVIRMCLASRSLPEIEPQLGAYPRCQIHEWTAADISEYVTAKFAKAWSRLRHFRIEKDFQNLGVIENIINKAGGVFLWVEVVVNNLIIGLEDGDTNEELMECLESLPSDLEDLYARIIQRIPLKYLKDAITYISILVGNKHHRVRNRLSLINFALAVRDPEKALDGSITSTEKAHDDLQKDCENLNWRIKSRCRGLIHIQRPYGRHRMTLFDDNCPEPLVPSISKTVGFLHITVVKYITEAVIDGLKGKVNGSLMKPASLHLQAAILAEQKMLPLHQLQFKVNHSNPPQYAYLEYLSLEYHDHRLAPQRFFLYARDAEEETDVPQRPFMKELDRVCTQGSETWCMELHALLCNLDRYRNLKGGMPNRKSSHIDLHCISLFMGIEKYILEELEFHGYNPTERQGRPLLEFLVDGIEIKGELLMQHNANIVKLLCKYGASPNQLFQARPTWQCALDIVLRKNWVRSDHYQLLIAMLECGADPNQRLSNDQSPIMQAASRFDAERWDEIGEVTMELVGSFIDHGVDLEKDLESILSAAERLSPRLRAFIVEKIDEREAAKPQEKPMRKTKRKGREVAIRQSKRRAKGT